MDNNIAFTASVVLKTHEHRPTTIKRYYNDRCTMVVYCADCHAELDSYVKQLNNDEIECPIGAADSIEIS